MGSLIKERKALWHKSWKESREEDLLAIAGQIQTQGWLQTSQKEKSRGGISENLPEELQEKRRTQEDEVWEEFEIYMMSYHLGGNNYSY